MPRDESDKATQTGERTLTESGFAKVMLRLIGIYFAAFGLIGVVSMFIQLAIRASRPAEKPMEHFPFEWFVRPGLELLVGIYLLLGGHWLFRKLLTPVRRPPQDDDFEKPA
jgi:hypothetical protein